MTQIPTEFKLTGQPQTTVIHGPYEDLAIAVVQLIQMVIEGQPPEVREQLWRMHFEDVKAWRQWCSEFKEFFE